MIVRNNLAKCIKSCTFKKNWENLDRQEAVVLLRELIAANLIQPTLISLEKNSNNTFSITMKIDTNLLGIRAFFG
jgi:hypothetical protein